MAMQRKKTSKIRSKKIVRPQGKLARTPIECLRFDPKNPRVVELVGEDASQKHILEVLLGPEMQARDLVPSFIENGYLPYEPLIVRPMILDHHVVLEGNRRLAALVSMRDSDDAAEFKAFAHHELESVPCIVFEGDEQQELAYLGLRHLSKTKDWTAAAKAAFVERILSTGRSLQEAARLTNTTRHDLRLLLLTRRLFERAGELGIELPTSRAEGGIVFWHLGDAVRRTNTKKFLQMEESSNALEQPALDESNFELLLGWLFGNRKTKQPRLISTIREIPDLDRCLGNERATYALENGANISDALEELQAAGATVAAHLERAKKSVQRATGGVSDVDAEGRVGVRRVREDLGKAENAFDKAFRE